MKELEKNGHNILYNQFSKDANIVFVDSHSKMYKIYPLLKKIKRYKIKLVIYLADIPIWRLSKDGFKTIGILDEINQNYYITKLFLQYFYHIIHKHYILDKILNHLLQILNKYKTTKKLSLKINLYLNHHHQNNKIYYQINLKNFLKNSDLNLSMSKFTQLCFKKLLKVDSKVWYLSANSKLIENIKELPIKYDIINISRITTHKRQKLIVNASKKLGLKVIIIGAHQDKNIKLDCPHFCLNHLNTMKELKKSRIYVDASMYEGFGLTPVEAVFSGKIVIASDTYIHREVLGNYPLYFIKDDLDDLMKKIKQALNGEFKLDKEAAEQIKKKYSVESGKNKLEKFLKSIINKKN